MITNNLCTFLVLFAEATHSSIAGVHVMLKTSSGVRYALYSLASSKPEPGGTMPKDCAAFLTQPGAKDIQLYPTGDVRNKYCKGIP